MTVTENPAAHILFPLYLKRMTSLILQNSGSFPHLHLFENWINHYRMLVLAMLFLKIDNLNCLVVRTPIHCLLLHE